MWPRRKKEVIIESASRITDLEDSHSSLKLRVRELELDLALILKKLKFKYKITKRDIKEDEPTDIKDSVLLPE